MLFKLLLHKFPRIFLHKLAFSRRIHSKKDKYNSRGKLLPKNEKHFHTIIFFARRNSFCSQQEKKSSRRKLENNLWSGWKTFSISPKSFFVLHGRSWGFVLSLTFHVPFQCLNLLSLSLVKESFSTSVTHKICLNNVNRFSVYHINPLELRLTSIIKSNVFRAYVLSAQPPKDYWEPKGAIDVRCECFLSWMCVVVGRHYIEGEVINRKHRRRSWHWTFPIPSNFLRRKEPKFSIERTLCGVKRLRAAQHVDEQLK